jgi:endogenous inhibitor of DNA gyrase (YacG/DUF329 family)
MAPDTGTSAADEADRAPRGRGVSCPSCGDHAAWVGNPHRPFCSLTCRLIDLGVWLDERYRIAGGDRSSELPSQEADVP